MKCLRKVVIHSFAAICAGLAVGLSTCCADVGDTNRLWLEMALENSAATFTIHPPETNAYGVFDLYYKTNISACADWTWLLRNYPGQTVYTLSNLPPEQGYFTLMTTNAIRPGFEQQVLDRNDDGSTDVVPLGFYINFYGSSNTTLYVNNNGDVTFDSPQSEYSPKNLASLGVEVVAPFWADVDTRNAASGVVRYGTNTVNGHDAFGANWVDVGYYSQKADKLLSCQLVIISRSDIAPGDFDLEFNYDKVQWQWGDVTLNNPPRAGFANSSSSYELPGSGVNGAFMDTNAVTGLIYYNTNSSVPGRYIYRFRDGSPVF